MTDPSYKGQFVVFTCPHIGNVGINPGVVLSSPLHEHTVAAARRQSARWRSRVRLAGSLAPLQPHAMPLLTRSQSTCPAHI